MYRTPYRAIYRIHFAWYQGEYRRSSCPQKGIALYTCSKHTNSGFARHSDCKPWFLTAKGTLISEPRFSTPCEMRFFPREKSERENGLCRGFFFGKAVCPFSRGTNRISQGVENRGSLISVPLALRVVLDCGAKWKPICNCWLRDGHLADPLSTPYYAPFCAPYCALKVPLKVPLLARSLLCTRKKPRYTPFPPENNEVSRRLQRHF